MTERTYTADEVDAMIARALAREPKQLAQEPVAWMDKEKKIVYWHNTHDVDDYHGFKRTTPLYTLPQARESEQPAQEPEFFTHCVDQPSDWSEWVCPDPKSYLMKCCDCGLVHEAQFGVVRYKSETEREECDIVDDPNLQAVFRMRRSEQWSPVDTAHRAGGLTMEQPSKPTALQEK